MIDRTSSVPLWRQLVSVLRLRIEADDLTVLPTEAALVAEFGVSRQTVREALRQLTAVGLVERQRGRGTFVTRPPVEQPLASMYSIAPAVRQYGANEHTEVLKRGFEADPAAAHVFRIPPRTRLATLQRLRFVDAEPIMLVTTWYLPEIGERLFKEDLRERSAYQLLGADLGMPVTGGHERIQADLPTEYERGLLRMPEHAAVLRVERVGLHRETPIEYRRSVVRGDRYAFLAQWPTVTSEPGTEWRSLTGPY